MEHEPAPKWQAEKSEGFKTKLGLYMFGIFAPVYLAFILVCIISPKLMAKDIGSLNVAIVFGFGIIILAIILAIIYNAICSKRESMENKTDEIKGDAGE